MLRDILWWTRFFIKKALVFGLLVAAGWYALNYTRTPPPKPAKQEIEKKQIDVFEAASKRLTDEQKQSLEEIGLGKGALTVEYVSPMSQVDKSLDPARRAARSVGGGYDRFIDWLKNRWAGFLSFVKTLFGVSVCVLLGFRLAKLWEPLRITSLFMLQASNVFLVLSSVAGLVMTFGFNVNVWRDTDLVIFWMPAGLLAAGAAGSWLVDENFPVWKTIYTGLSFPIISGFGMMIKNAVL